MKRLKIQDFGTEVQGVELQGDRRNPEPTHFRVVFPGGDVDIARTTDDDYWVHVRVNRPGNTIAPDAPRAIITDARLDIVGKHATESKLGDFADPNLYHLAVRVTKDQNQGERR